MRLFTYQMPDELIAVANQGSLTSSTSTRFFGGKGRRQDAEFAPQDRRAEVARSRPRAHLPTQVDAMRMGTRPRFPIRCPTLPYLQHSFWFLPNVAACEASVEPARGEAERVLARLQGPRRRGSGAGIGRMLSRQCGRRSATATTRRRSPCRAASSPRRHRQAVVLDPMLRNLKPETYFSRQPSVCSHRGRSANPDGDNPSAEAVLKPVCFSSTSR